MGIFLCHSRYSFHTLSTAHASRTHVKAPQPDLHGKPDNSPGPAHERPSERPSRTKATFRHEKAPKSIEESRGGTKWPETTQFRRGPTLPPCSSPSRNRDQGPNGSIETKTSSLSLLRAMAEASKQQVSPHGSYATLIEAFKAWFRRLVSILSPSLSYLYPYLARVSSYVYRAIYMSPHFEG